MITVNQLEAAMVVLKYRRVATLRQQKRLLDAWDDSAVWTMKIRNAEDRLKVIDQLLAEIKEKLA